MVDKIFYAHSFEGKDKVHWQKLDEHLLNVAKRAGEMAAPFGYSKAAYAAGLFHDLGKYTVEFQRRLEGGKERVDHSTAGAKIIIELAKGRDKDICKIIAYAIAGHHAGLPDQNAEVGSLSDRLKFFIDNLDPKWMTELAPELTGLEPNPQFNWQSKNAAFQFAFLGRMIFSCLVDADFKDTEKFYDEAEGRTLDRGWPTLLSLLPEFTSKFNDYIARKADATKPINALRTDILSTVRSKAALKPGLFTLTVPTGGGKTLASLGFALDHAKAHGHSRIIYAIPFTSIIDQTAKIFGDILGQENILEHHSNIDEEGFKEREGRDKLKLAMEDWAAPVVVTTNVQFFESLFASRTSRSRKLHNIAGSVIILDEAQTIPRNLLSPCVRVLDELALNYGCTIVLCTATQPALDANNFQKDHPAGLQLKGRELAPDPIALSKAMQRVTLQQVGALSNDELVAVIRQTPQGLIIVNSRKHALALYQAAKAAGLEGVIHLSTRQYGVHRREILNDVRGRLVAEQPCRVISTSLVEAGVDLDFPLVWRAEAGLDQIAQAAGRCNREGKRPTTESVVTVFAAPDFPPPAEIKALSGDKARMMDKHANLLSPEAINDYFGEVYWRLGEKGLDSKSIIERFKVDKFGTNFAYRSVAEDFRMIESGMVPVIVSNDEHARKWVRNLDFENISSGRIARELQSYIVQVPQKARQLLIANGRVAFKNPKIRGDQFAVLTDQTLYKKELGLLWENADYLSTEALVN